MEPRVGPRQHAGGLVLVEQLEADEQPEHGASKRLSQSGRVLYRPGDKGAVGSEAAIGDEQVQVRMPVSPRPMGLQAGDDPDGELSLPGECTDGGGDGAGERDRQAGELSHPPAFIRDAPARGRL